MLRTLFSPRLVGLHLVTIGVLISFTVLGRWQLGVFEESARPHAKLDPAPVAMSTLLRPGGRLTAETIGRRVTVQGTFDASRQLLVAERLPNVETGGGAVPDSGFWLLTPLRLPEGGTAAVVRGWVRTADDPAVAVPEGQVSVTGRLQPSEPTDFARRRSAPLPPGQVATVSTAVLVNVWRGAGVRDGFVVATAPVPGAAPVRAVDVPAPTEAGGFNWRNLAYAAQWWIFAAFAVFMWFHFVRDAVRGRKRDAAGDAPAPALGASPGA
ncbi:SURF1 family protein [Sphaerisporangium sp. TRM90804]|uniref:SURF1 family protein n=1 Tax=Sphaerisporangium sp. TRM90804 TaxID=3031113 RepID=UPI002446F49F|nr:SURF1 family protein [Sphaerisporangium sp. TRM90804]MDH2427948.1 SURF1 family protein [Sphaerisporangium sp. TRM90804]